MNTIASVVLIFPYPWETNEFVLILLLDYLPHERRQYQVLPSSLSSSIIYKIKEERDKRTDHTKAKSKINFYLTYEELYQSNHQDHSKLNIRDKLEPIQRFGSGQKDRKHMSHINHAKKISLNFDLFNPKKKVKEEGEDNSKVNY